MGGAGNWKKARVFTIGHSTRTADELIELLRAFDISVLADIRTIPRSRHNPQFDGDALRRSLRPHRIGYVHLKELGGLRKARKNSPNAAWRNASFRGFADYMLTGDFEAGLQELRALVAEKKVALMCAEAVPWRCHRSLVADALTARGARVSHITGPTRAAPHRMTEFAQVERDRVTYPSEHPIGMELATRAPFHLEATVRVLQRRPANLVDVWEAGSYRRVLPTGDGLALVDVANHGTVDRPDVRLVVLRGAVSRAKLEPVIRRVLGLDVDPRALQSRVESERRLRPVATALRGMRPPRFAGLFETFAGVVPFQQVSLDAGIAILRRLVERFGAVLKYGGRAYHAFPEAGVVAEARVEALKKCGLSLRKAEALRALARAVEDGRLTEPGLSRMSSPEAARFLQEQAGIGPWSASLVLLRGLGRLDVFPPGDAGVARGLRNLLRLDAGPAFDRVVRRFGELRGYLYFCSLGAGLLARGLITAAPAV